MMQPLLLADIHINSGAHPDAHQVPHWQQVMRPSETKLARAMIQRKPPPPTPLPPCTHPTSLSTTFQPLLLALFAAMAADCPALHSPAEPAVQRRPGSARGREGCSG